MNDYYTTVMGNLSCLTVEELNKVIEAAKRKKEKIETDKRCSAATNLVEAFKAYKKATGKHEVKLYNCIDSCYTSRTDVIVNINQLFVDDNGDICDKHFF